jgi:hypothetical protein
VSGCPALIELLCDNNQLNSLDVSNLGKLSRLICPHNQLTSLDISKNIKLNYLLCYGNELKELDLRNNNELDFFNLPDTGIAVENIKEKISMFGTGSSIMLERTEGACKAKRPKNDKVIEISDDLPLTSAINEKEISDNELSYDKIRPINSFR